MNKRHQNRPLSAAYWRTRYEQLQSDFNELVAINSALVRRVSALKPPVPPKRKPTPKKASKYSNRDFRYRPVF